MVGMTSLGSSCLRYMKTLKPALERRGPIGHRRVKRAKDMRHRVDQKNTFDANVAGSSLLSWHVFR